ncbi:hypothetical protein BGY98DRAFT_988548 [Russula aff. rugulosa BPL654]|nr:hypothetical protein BGY98DRAFT_988548 [Russula aff. rugulosa BPL654]
MMQWRCCSRQFSFNVLGWHWGLTLPLTGVFVMWKWSDIRAVPNFLVGGPTASGREPASCQTMPVYGHLQCHRGRLGGHHRRSDSHINGAYNRKLWVLVFYGTILNGSVCIRLSCALPLNS